MFEVPCPECGADVEFFKDESTGRCGACGHRFRNPGMDFGCAQWCALAEECLGIAPERDASAYHKEGALAGRLIQELREAFRGDAARLTHALKVYHFAKELVAQEGGNPRVTLAAALLLEVAGPPAGDRGNDQGSHNLGKVETILGQIGVDESTGRSVCQILAARSDGEPGEGIESRVVRDADRLARLTMDDLRSPARPLDEVIAEELATEAARQRARKLFRVPRDKADKTGETPGGNEPR